MLRDTYVIKYAVNINIRHQYYFWSYSQVQFVKKDQGESCDAYKHIALVRPIRNTIFDRRYSRRRRRHLVISVG